MKYPTSPDLSIKPGDLVRSFDFVGVENCYYEGIVEAVVERHGLPGYRIRVVTRVFEGIQAIDGRQTHIWAPQNGLTGVFGLTRGVIRVEA